MRTPSLSYGTSLAVMGSHSVTCHPTQVNAPRLTPAMQAGTYPGGMEGWVDLVDLIVPRPGAEPAIFRSRVWRRTAAPPRQPYSAIIVAEPLPEFTWLMRWIQKRRQVAANLWSLDQANRLEPQARLYRKQVNRIHHRHLLALLIYPIFHLNRLKTAVW